MNIDYLVKELQNLQARGHGGVEVVLSSDDEGNSFRKLYQLDDVRVMAAYGHEIETIWNEEGTEVLEELPDDEPDAFLAVVLW